MNLGRRRAGDSREKLDREPKLERKAFENAPDDCARLLGHGLAGAGTEIANAFRHRPGDDEGSVIGVDERGESRSALGRVNELVEPERRPSGSPCALTLVHEPETVYVPQQADCAVHPTLVGQVRAERVVVDERPVELHTDERPRSSADVHRLSAAERNRDDRRCRVVGRRGNRDRAAQACPLGHLVEEGAEDRGRADDVREDSGR